MLSVKVLGPGCGNCKRLEQIVRRTVADFGLAAEIEKVTDYKDIMQYDVISTPGLVINDQVVAMGRVPSPAEITVWLTDGLAAKVE